MSPTDRIDYSVQNQVAVIAMNRPPVNAIDHAMIEAVHTALRQAEADTAVRAVILTSTLPGMFCGGMDLRMIAQGDVQNLRAFHEILYWHDGHPVRHDQADHRRDQRSGARRWDDAVDHQRRHPRC